MARDEIHVTFDASNGFVSDQQLVGPHQVPFSIIHGEGVWIRNSGRMETWNGVEHLGIPATEGDVMSPTGLVVSGTQIVATQQSGNTVQYRSGALLSVGSGLVRLNGNDLLVAKSTLQVAIPTGMNTAGFPLYTIRDAGLAAPAAPALATVIDPGSTLAAGSYSVRLIAKSSITQGQSNPSPPTTIIVAAGQAIRVTFPPAVNGQDAWIIAVTKKDQASSGPWFELKEVPMVVAGATYDIFWTDGELVKLISYDRDLPPNASFVVSLDDVAVLLGTFGIARGRVNVNGTNVTYVSGDKFDTAWRVDTPIFIGTQQFKITAITNETSLTVDTAPAAGEQGYAYYQAKGGPGISPSIPGNPEAYPIRALAYTAHQEPVLGYAVGKGQIFLLTRNSLQVARLTGQESAPVVVYPLWNVGFSNPYAGVVANGLFFGFTNRGAARTRDLGDPDFEFARSVRRTMQNWDPQNVFVSYDTRNASVLFIHAEDPTSGRTTVLAYSLETGLWSTLLIISGDTSLPGKVQAGTVAITAGSNVVTGTGTSFTTAYKVGDDVKIAGGIYSIASITNNTSMTISPVAQTTASGVAHARMRMRVTGVALTGSDTFVVCDGLVFRWDNGNYQQDHFLEWPFFDFGTDYDKRLTTVYVSGTFPAGARWGIWTDLESVLDATADVEKSLAASPNPLHYDGVATNLGPFRSARFRIVITGKGAALDKVQVNGYYLKLRRFGDGGAII